MHNRIKQVQKDSKLSQDEFAQRIGVSKSGVQKIQSGVNNPSEQTLRMICSEFNVNRHWLETGEGEMHECTATDTLIDMLMPGESEFAKNIVKRYFAVRATLSDEQKAAMDAAWDMMLGQKKKEGE